MRGIWKHPKTENWIARYRGANGKWVNRSTATSNAEEAERVAAGWKLEAERERARQVSNLSAGGITDTVARAERLARSGRLDAQSARSLINDLLTAAGQEPLDAVTNRAWCDGWKDGKAGSVKQRSQWKYDQVSRDWLKFLNGKADKPLEAVSKAEAISFRDRLTKAGLAARTVNQTVKLLRGIYSEAVEAGHIGRNPFTGIKPLLQDPEGTARLPFTVEDVATLIKTAEGDWKGLVILAATTGLRLMDAARLSWRSLDLTAGVISIKTAKTGVTLTLPLHPGFAAWLAAQTRGIGAAPVFPSLANKGGAGKSGLSMAFRRLMERAKIEAGVGRAAEGRGRTFSTKSFHSLRHFAATQLATASVRPEIARQITGHADAETHANYITADLAALRGAVNSIRLSA
jgi:integrase